MKKLFCILNLVLAFPIIGMQSAAVEPDDEACAQETRATSSIPFILNLLQTPMHPQKRISQHLIELIQQSNAVSLCFYRFTLGSVAGALITRKIRYSSFKAELIVDKDEHLKDIAAIQTLIRNGFKCYSNKPQHHHSYYSTMHSKFGIFDLGNEKRLWTGTWNCTGNADENNIEHVTITNDAQSVSQFEKFFGTLKAKSTEVIITKKQNVKKISKYSQAKNKSNPLALGSIDTVNLKEWKEPNAKKTDSDSDETRPQKRLKN